MAGSRRMRAVQGRQQGAEAADMTDDFVPPLADIRFSLRHIAGLERIAALPGLEHATPDVVDAVLEEAGRFAAGVLAPLNRVGDLEGATLENGVVRTPTGF